MLVAGDVGRQAWLAQAGAVPMLYRLTLAQAAHLQADVAPPPTAPDDVSGGVIKVWMFTFIHFNFVSCSGRHTEPSVQMTMTLPGNYIALNTNTPREAAKIKIPSDPHFSLAPTLYLLTASTDVWIEKSPQIDTEALDAISWSFCNEQVSHRTDVNLCVLRNERTARKGIQEM